MRIRSAPPKWRGGNSNNNSNRFPSLLLPRLALIVGALLLCLFLLFATTTTTTTTTLSSLPAPSLRTTSSPPTRAPRLQRYPWATVYPQSVPSVTLQNKERGPSWPFVTGDGFRFMANVIIDETIGMVGIPIVVPALVQQACRDVVRVHHDPNSSSNGEGKTNQEVEVASPSPSSPPRPVVVFVQTHYLDTFLASWAAHAPKEATTSSSSSSSPPTTTATAADASSSREAKVKQCRIVLVTHNSDYSAPYEAGDTLLKPGRQQQPQQLPQQKMSNNDEDVLPPTRYQHHGEWILNNPLQFQKWFAQNAAMRHPRLVPIPIGIENRYNRYGPHFSVYREIAASARPLRERSRWLLVSFSLKTNKKERLGALNAVSTPEWMEKNESFRTLLTKFPAKGGADRKKPTAEAHRETLKLFLSAAAQHKFVLAPRGHGLDTHRLWEALYMGCIPIVRRSTMDPLLETLPVLLVDDYREVTPDRLAAAAVELGPRFEDPERMKWLTMEGWTAEIRSALALQ